MQTGPATLTGKRDSSATSTAQAERSVNPASLWPWLVVCALVAACIDLGHLHRFQHADAILYELVSLQRWTVYSWDQDRFGMLIPLLALPFRHPLFNLIVQGWLTTFSALAAFFLFARYLLPNSLWPLAATLAAACVLTFTPASVQFDWFVTQHVYTVSIALILVAFLLLEGEARSPRRYLRSIAALFLSVVAHWVNVAASAIFMPLLLFRLAQSPASGRFAREALKYRKVTRHAIAGLRNDPNIAGIGLLVIGTLSGQLIRRLVRHFNHFVPTSFQRIPVREWPASWHRLASAAWHAFLPKPISLFWVLVPVLAAIVLILALPARRARLRQMAALTVALGGTALLYGLASGTVAWVQMNLNTPFAARYLIPPVFLLIVLSTALPVFVLPDAWAEKLRRYILPASTIVLLSAAVWIYRVPSVATVRADLDRLGTATPEILAARINMIAGDYWTVWPAVFHADLVLYERREHRTIYGLTYRSLSTRKLWSRVPLDEVRAAVPLGQEVQGQQYLHTYGFNLTKVEHRAQFDVFAQARSAFNFGVRRRGSFESRDPALQFFYGAGEPIAYNKAASNDNLRTSVRRVTPGLIASRLFRIGPLAPAMRFR